MAAADYRLMTEATGQRIAIALENLAITAPIQSVLLTGDVNTSSADSATIGYRSTGSDSVNLITMQGWPTGKTILGMIVEEAYTGNVAESAIITIHDYHVYANTVTQTTVHFGIRVLYR